MTPRPRPPRPALPILTLSLCGQVTAAVAGAELRLRSRKARALLGYLALTEGHRDSRESVAGLLWSEAGPRQARDSLRQIVQELRDAFDRAGFDGVDVSRPVLSLAPDRVAVDVWDLAAAAAAGRAHPLLLGAKRVTETLMKGLDDLDEAFRSWLVPRRQTLHGQLVRQLENGLRAPRTARDMRYELAQGLLNLDPTHEEACRALMRARAEDGDSAGAQRLYEQLLALLADEFDMEPSDETAALYGDIKAGTVGPAASDPVFREGMRHVLAGRERPPPAELPLAARLALRIGAVAMDGVAADKAHLVEGFRLALIASLVRFREWYVMDAMAQPGQPEPAGGGKPVAATYGIDGAAHEADGGIGIVLTLRELDSRHYIWSDSFELAPTGWIEARQRIIRRVAMSLNVQISAERLQRLEGRPDVSLDVHDRWLRGQALSRRFGADNWNRAARIYEEAIRDAPGFSPAYSSLAQMNNVMHMAHPGLRRDMARAEATLALARKAVALDPLDSRAQLALGWALAMMDRQPLAVAPMELACDLNPYDSWTLISAALFHAYDGNPARARALAGDSIGHTLAPTLMHWGYEGTIRFMEGDYAAAVNATEQAQDVIPTLPGWRAAALHYLGAPDAARREGRRFLSVIRTRWAGAEPPSDGAIGNWLLHQYPLSRRADWERLRQGVIGAGLPVDPIEHQRWW